MTHRGSGSGGPHPQVLVLVTGLVALLGIPVGLAIAGWDRETPARGPAPAVSANASLVPAAAPARTPADVPIVTVRELPARQGTTAPVTLPRKPATAAPAPAVSSPARRMAAMPPPTAPKPHAKVRRTVKAVVVARRRPERRHLASAAPAPAVAAKHPAPVERRTVAASAPVTPRPERVQTREREYASREPAPPREKPSRERPKRERSRHREASRPKEPEAFGAGNSGFHYGASYDPYSMHVGR